LTSAHADLIVDLNVSNNVTNSAKIENIYQKNATPAAFQNIVAASLVKTDLVATGVVNSVTDSNKITAPAIANTSTSAVDLVLGTGAGGNISVTSVAHQANDTIGSFSEVTGSSVTSNVKDAVAASSISLSSNTIGAESSLNTLKQSVQGKLDLTFNTTDVGTVSMSAIGVDADTTTTNEITGDAGILVTSSQYNTTVIDDTAGHLAAATNAGFAVVDGVNSIALTNNGTFGAGLKLAADNNSLTAIFTGNNATNLLDVQTGGATTLSSSAGIASQQTNVAVDANGTATAGGSSATLGDGTSLNKISASVADTKFENSNLSFTSNRLAASATGSVAANTLNVTKGLNVSAEGTQANTLVFDTTKETSTTSGGLFVTNMQLAKTSDIIATATSPNAGNDLSVDSRGLVNSTIKADSNSFAATALGNDASSALTVGGATTFSAAVAASNLQSFNSGVVSASALNGNLAVTLAGTAADAVTGATVTVDNNTFSSLAVANRDPLTVSITGTGVSDNVSQVATSSVDNTAKSVATAAGFSAISSQDMTRATGGTTVTATTTGAGIDLQVSNTTGTLSNSTFELSGNKESSLANLNEGVVSLAATGNELEASAAAVSVQNGKDNAVATTSGQITSLLTPQSGVANNVNTNLTALVGDGNLKDTVAAGNAITATAGGDINATTLTANATTLKVVGVIDTDAGAAALNNDGKTDTAYASVQLDSGTLAALANKATAALTVLTDQRLTASEISASVTSGKISSQIVNGTDALTNATNTVSGNSITAAARGALTADTLTFTAENVDMTKADAFNDTGDGSKRVAAGTNLASIGAVQVLDSTSPVSATVTAGAGSEILGDIGGTATASKITQAVNANTVAAQAWGGVTTSTLTGSGVNLAQDAGSTVDPVAVLAGSLTIDPVTVATSSDLKIGSTAVANGVVQDNAAAVKAALGTTADYGITSQIVGASYHLSNVSISADTNKALAVATGLSDTTTTSLTFTNQETSAAVGVRQSQSGATTANVGVVGTGGVTITALADNATQKFVDSTLTASSNTVGAEAYGASNTASLKAGDANTVSLVSGFGDTTTDAASGSIEPTIVAASAYKLTASADYSLGVQQNVSGATTASGEDMSVLASLHSLQNSSMKAENNLLAAQATGGTSTSTLTLTAANMTAASAENTVDAALLSEQNLSNTVTATTKSSDVKATAINLDETVVTNNGADTLSLASNKILAVGTGLYASNTLTSASTTGTLGDPNTSAGVNGSITNLAAPTTKLTGSADRLLISNQDVATAGKITSQTNTNKVEVALTGETEGDSLKNVSNQIAAQGIAASVANTMSITGGANLHTTGGLIVSRQDSDGQVQVDNMSSQALMTISGAATKNSTLQLSSNQLTATATGIAGTNSIAASGDASVVMALDNGADLDIDPDSATNYIIGIGGSYVAETLQTLTASANGITAKVSDPKVSLSNKVATTSTLEIDQNSLAAASYGATSTNSVSAKSAALGTEVAESGVTLGIASAQSSAAAVGSYIDATTGGTSVDLTVTGASTGSTLNVTKNSLSATSANLTGVNTLEAIATGANTGDDYYANVSINTAGRTTPATVLLDTVQADRVIATDQYAAGTGSFLSYNRLDPTVVLNVTGDMTASSAANLTGNSITAAGTMIGNTSTLTNSAGTLLSSGSLIATVQESVGAASGSYVLDGDIAMALGGAVTNSKAALSENAVTSTAIGLTSTDTLKVSGGSIQGGQIAEAALAADNKIVAGTATSAANILGKVLSFLGLSQTSSTAVTAEVGQGADFENSALTLAVSGAVSGSALDLDKNVVQATATGAAGSNTLTQTAATSMSGALADSDAGAGIGVSQHLTGATTAKITGITDKMSGAGVSASVLSVDSNTVQAVATGGSLVNALNTTAGTSIALGANSTNKSSGGTISYTGAAEITADYTGVYSINSAQKSAGAATATVANGTDVAEGNPKDEFPTISMAFTGDYAGNSAVSVSDNMMRAQAINLTATNSVSTKAGTDLNLAGTGLINGQGVTAATTAQVAGGEVNLSGSALTGTAAENTNWMVAVGTGATATNSVTVSSDTITGTTADANSLLNTKIIGTNSAPSVTSGDNSLASLLNEQVRTGAVTASLDDALANDAKGNLKIAASFSTITGTASVKNNLMAAQARGLYADNTVVETAASLTSGGGAALGSVQSGSTGTVAASINTGTTAAKDEAKINLIATGATTGTVALTGNTVQSDAGSNIALNKLTITSGTGLTNLGTSTTSTATYDGTADGITGATTGIALQNAQASGSTVNSVINKFEIEGSFASVTGTANVDSNKVLAQARGQVAENSLTATAGSDFGASASLANLQRNSGALNAVIDTGKVSLTSAGNGTSLTGTSTLNGNTVQASTAANQAINSMDLTGKFANAGGGTGSINATANTNTAAADYAALNAQTNTGASAAQVTGYTVALNAVAMNGSAEVKNNTIAADARGNSASNTFTINAVGGSGTADFAFNGYQNNTGAVTAAVSGSKIGAGTSAAIGGTVGVVTVSGNTIGASATGNVSSSAIKTKNSSFTSL
jgi:hypothetical protein